MVVATGPDMKMETTIGKITAIRIPVMLKMYLQRDPYHEAAQILGGCSGYLQWQLGPLWVWRV